MARYHKFGVRINGVLNKLSGVCYDEEFERVTAAGLPQGWCAWHIDDWELEEPASDRVRTLRALPELAIRWQDALQDALAGRPLGTTGYAVQIFG